MTDIFVTGSKSDTEIEMLIKNRLSRNYAVTYINKNKFSRTGKGYNLIVFDSEKPVICSERSILYMKEKGIVPENLPQDTTVIFNVENKEQIKAISCMGIRTIACGMCATATVSFSSETDETLTVSLNRSITALSGRIIEPLELPVIKEAYSNYAIMSFAALRFLLDDFDSELGKLM